MATAFSRSDAVLLHEPPDLDLAGRVAWITGAGRGLGRSIACAFAGAGAEVFLSGRSEGPLEEVKSAILEAGGRAETIPGSVADPADVENAVARIGDHSGGRLDCLVNNAGISPYFVRSEQLEPHQMSEVLDTNLVGAFACTRAAFPLLQRGHQPSVVNVSSVYGSRSAVRMLAYGAAKGGLEMLTRTLADEWADSGVRVNSLAPGYIETEMSDGLRKHRALGAELLARTPLNRFANTAEIAACALFLASPIASYVTGATLVADGGWSAR